MIPTPHIEAIPDLIAKTVPMPGDPLRAKYIAEKYLKMLQHSTPCEECLGLPNI